MVFDGDRGRGSDVAGEVVVVGRMPLAPRTRAYVLVIHLVCAGWYE